MKAVFEKLERKTLLVVHMQKEINKLSLILFFGTHSSAIL